MNYLKFIPFALIIIFLNSCVSSKKFKSLEATSKNTELTLATTSVELAKCKEDLARYEKDVNDLKKMNSDLIGKIGDLTMLTKQEAENMQMSLLKIREKDLQIKSLNEALTRKDSITIALVTNLKGAVGIHDQDIEINVEKGVIFISISDKFLFRSGSYIISPAAKEVLGKVAKVLNDKPELEVLVEGHTDNVPFRRDLLLDNWDLSVKRATALVRMLQTDFKIAPGRMMAAGRGEYVPLASNQTAEGRAANRRTRIIILPKLEDFVGLIEEGLSEKE